MKYLLALVLLTSISTFAKNEKKVDRKPQDYSEESLDSKIKEAKVVCTLKLNNGEFSAPIILKSIGENKGLKSNSIKLASDSKYFNDNYQVIVNVNRYLNLEMKQTYAATYKISIQLIDLQLGASTNNSSSSFVEFKTDMEQYGTDSNLSYQSKKISIDSKTSPINKAVAHCGIVRI